MPFPLSYTSRVEVPFDDNKHTPEKLHCSIVLNLERVKARNIRDDGNDISFSGGIFRFVSGWNILKSVSSGRITIEKKQNKLCLNYTLKFTELFILSTIGAIGLLSPSIWQALERPFVDKAGILIFAWGVLFGMHYCQTILRFKSFIKKMTETKKELTWP